MHSDWGKVGYRLDWVGFPFGVSVKSRSVVAMSLYPDIAVVQESGSVVSAIETSNGQNRWAAELTGPLTKWVGVVRESSDAGRLLVCSESEMFILAPGTGNILGREPLSRVVNTSPVLVDSLAVFGTSTGVVQSHIIGRGLPSWGFASRGAIDADPVLVGAQIATVSQGGDVTFLSTSGELVGRARVFGPLDNNPVTDGERLYIASRDQSVWCFDTAGNLVWRHRTPHPLSAQPALHDGVLYVDLGPGGLTAFDAVSGEVKWAAKDVHGTPIALRDRRLVVRDAAGLTVVDPARGDAIARIELPGVARVMADGFIDPNIYAISDAGVLAKFMPR
ncbi:MAG: PQQ-binding-like beta-propeller repeat protein [Planctomycetota bacterium]|nr:PQQ-binding-like beta-propeller repeat protein [Planctomycetota bacterium]